MRNALSAATLAVAALSTGAEAAGVTGLVEFNGVAGSACSFSGAHGGTMKVDGSLRSFRTDRPGSIDITQTGGLESFVVVSAPMGWTSKPAGAADADFSVAGQIEAGANPQLFSFAGSGGAATLSMDNPGTDRIDVSLGADALDPFQKGDYVAEVTFTCSVR